VPKGETKIRNWLRYAIEPFVVTDLDFDTILVDGRFRVHCLLAIASCVSPNARILLHDYHFRHGYTIADKYFDTLDRVESSVVLRVRPIDKPTISLHRSDQFTVFGLVKYF
jgi:hypothetical protein